LNQIEVVDDERTARRCEDDRRISNRNTRHHVRHA
jgi:hypothetical protein